MGTPMSQQSLAITRPNRSHSARPIVSKVHDVPSQKVSADLPVFSLFSAGQRGRDDIESFIDQQFFESYGARHSEYMPWLIALSHQGRLSTCAGVAFAVDKNPLFLERYLPSSVEMLMSERFGVAITRGQIAEVGNLAGSSFCGEHIGSSRLFYIVLASVLQELGIQWMVFTATGPLLRSLQRLGLSHSVLGDADESFLDEAERDRWGSYYEYQPRVVAAPLSSANESIRQRALFASIKQYYAGSIAVMTDQLAAYAVPGGRLAQ